MIYTSWCSSVWTSRGFTSKSHTVSPDTENALWLICPTAELENPHLGFPCPWLCEVNKIRKQKRRLDRVRVSGKRPCWIRVNNGGKRNWPIPSFNRALCQYHRLEWLLAWIGRRSEEDRPHFIKARLGYPSCRRKAMQVIASVDRVHGAKKSYSITELLPFVSTCWSTLLQDFLTPQPSRQALFYKLQKNNTRLHAFITFPIDHNSSWAGALLQCLTWPPHSSLTLATLRVPWMPVIPYLILTHRLPILSPARP